MSARNLRRGHLVGPPLTNLVWDLLRGLTACGALVVVLLLVMPSRVESAMESQIRTDLEAAGLKTDNMVIDIDWRNVSVATDTSGEALIVSDVLLDSPHVGATSVRPFHTQGADPVRESLAVQLSDSTVLLSGSLTDPQTADRLPEAISGRQTINLISPVPSASGRIPDRHVELMETVLGDVGPSAGGSLTSVDGQMLVRLSGLTESELTQVAETLSPHQDVRFTAVR